MFRFQCSCCDEWHEGMPGFAADAPLYYYAIPSQERDRRNALDTDTCVIDQQYLFARGCLEIPVHDETEPFVWGVWVSLGKTSFDTFSTSLTMPECSHLGPFFGWLSAELALYPSTENLKTRLHLRDGVRP